LALSQAHAAWPWSQEQYRREENYRRGSAQLAVPGEELLMTVAPLVSIVDDDESLRESLPDLLRVLGFAARAFSSAEEFLASGYVDQTRCLLLDVAMPGMSGPDLQRELKLRWKEIPVVFITAQTHEAIRSRVLEQGAVECLLKPFSDIALLDAINTALRKSD
jgi:FixJ family two-component response regulator